MNSENKSMNGDNQDNILQAEEKILAEEKEVLQEIKKEEKKFLGLERKLAVTGILAALVVASAAAGLLYWHMASHQVEIDNSIISAPQIDLASQTAGPLEEVFVNEGDTVPANAVVARVGNELIKTKTAGLIISVKKDIGELFNPGTPVVSMIDPDELRVVGQIDENKGLSDIAIGQPATFTVDAFGGTRFTGVVDEITPTSDASAVVFNISDQREVRQFDVKVRFNVQAHPQFKNGMSAKIIIYQN